MEGTWMEGLPLDVFAQYGILGALVIGFLTGWISPGYLYKKLEDENARLRALVESKVIPAVEESSAALRASGEGLDKALTVMQQQQTLMDLQGGSPNAPSRRI